MGVVGVGNGVLGSVMGHPVYLLELETRRVADKVKMDWEIQKH